MLIRLLTVGLILCLSSTGYGQALGPFPSGKNGQGFIFDDMWYPNAPDFREDRELLPTGSDHTIFGKNNWLVAEGGPSPSVVFSRFWRLNAYTEQSRLNCEFLYPLSAGPENTTCIRAQEDPRPHWTFIPDDSTTDNDDVGVVEFGVKAGHNPGVTGKWYPGFSLQSGIYSPVGSWAVKINPRWNTFHEDGKPIYEILPWTRSYTYWRDLRPQHGFPTSPDQNSDIQTWEFGLEPLPAVTDSEYRINVNHFAADGLAEHFPPFDPNNLPQSTNPYLTGGYGPSGNLYTAYAVDCSGQPSVIDGSVAEDYILGLVEGDIPFYVFFSSDGISARTEILANLNDITSRPCYQYQHVFMSSTPSKSLYYSPAVRMLFGPLSADPTVATDDRFNSIDFFMYSDDPTHDIFSLTSDALHLRYFMQGYSQNNDTNRITNIPQKLSPWNGLSDEDLINGGKEFIFTPESFSQSIVTPTFRAGPDSVKYCTRRKEFEQRARVRFHLESRTGEGGLVQYPPYGDTLYDAEFVTSSNVFVYPVFDTNYVEQYFSTFHKLQGILDGETHFIRNGFDEGLGVHIKPEDFLFNSTTRYESILVTIKLTQMANEELLQINPSIESLECAKRTETLLVPDPLGPLKSTVQPLTYTSFSALQFTDDRSDVDVYDLRGRRIFHGPPHGIRNLTVGSGLFFVRQGTNVQRVFIVR